MSGALHLYVHLPFCAHRCGYCDFVTAVGRRGDHGRYVGALLAELELESDALAPRVETIFLGGGTPTFTEPTALERLLEALPHADEVTVETNPETIRPETARLLRRNRVNRVSIGAQSFHTSLLDVLERRAQPEDVRRAVHVLRDAGFDNLSLDLVYGIPGQSAADLERDLAEALALEPEHLSAYELEAKPGTRFTHAHGAELERQAESMESYFELVVETLTAAGYRWYETANFCRTSEGTPGRAGEAPSSGSPGGTAAGQPRASGDARSAAGSGAGAGAAVAASGGPGAGAGFAQAKAPDEGGRDLRSRHNLGYWLGHDYLGIGVGAVSTIENRRWRNAPSLSGYVAALRAGQPPRREVEELTPEVRATERLMLGLRLDQPLVLADHGGVVDADGLRRLERLGLAERRGEALALTQRGRFLGDAATAVLIA